MEVAQTPPYGCPGLSEGGERTQTNKSDWTDRRLVEPVISEYLPYGPTYSVVCWGLKSVITSRERAEGGRPDTPRMLSFTQCLCGWFHKNINAQKREVRKLQLLCSWQTPWKKQDYSWLRKWVV